MMCCVFRSSRLTKIGILQNGLREDEIITLVGNQFQPVAGAPIGIGDDCAVLPYPGLENDQYLLVSTDSMIEQCHFYREYSGAADLGWKLVMTTVSDIAAMGGVPAYLQLAVALPKSLPMAWVNHFFEGVETAAKQVGVAVTGGDTTGSEKIALNATVLGSATQPIYRHGSQVGDCVMVTGALGGASAGLRSLIDDSAPFSDIETLQQCYHRPVARVAEGQWLAKQSGVHAMMDLSDGLISDLTRMLRASDTSVTIDLADLPVHPALLRQSQVQCWDKWPMVVSGGEDYELLLTCDSSQATAIQAAFCKAFDKPLHIIGQLQKPCVGDQSTIVFTNQQQPVIIESVTHDHFGASNE